MYWVCTTDDERIELICKRRAFFSKMIDGYTYLHKFFVENDDRFAIMGMELSEMDNHLQIYIQLDFTEYYYIEKSKSGELHVCNDVTYDKCCAHTDVNIFTESYPNDETYTENS